MTGEHLMSRRSVLAVLGASALARVQAPVNPSPPAKATAGSATAEPLHFASLQDVARRIASREVSPVELTERMLARIATIDGALKSYATVMAEQARADARMAEQQIVAGRYLGPLHGVPVAVKDVCYTKGVRTMAGTSVLRSFLPDVDATVVAKLRGAGAVVLGKLNLTEGAMGGYHQSFDIPVNPWAADRWSGASSSGSGVAVAAGLCFAAIGTDTGGSIRYPASANGVAGLKPTYGRVSRFGVLPLAESLDHVGPMARSVADLAVMFDAIAGFDPADLTSLREPAPRTVDALRRPVEGLRVGIDRDYACTGVDRGQASSIEEALKVLISQGVCVVDVRMPDLNGITDAWFRIVGAEALVAHAAHYPSRASEYGRFFRDFLVSASKVTERQVAQARRRRTEFTVQFARLLESVDAMICPTGDVPAPRISAELLLGPKAALDAYWTERAATYDPPLKDTDLFTMPADLAGTPAVCVPSGFSPDGLPYSVQFVGRRLSEPTLCRIAHAYERATTQQVRHPNV